MLYTSIFSEKLDPKCLFLSHSSTLSLFLKALPLELHDKHISGWGVSGLAPRTFSAHFRIQLSNQTENALLVKAIARFCRENDMTPLKALGQLRRELTYGEVNADYFLSLITQVEDLESLDGVNDESEYTMLVDAALLYNLSLNTQGTPSLHYSFCKMLIIWLDKVLTYTNTCDTKLINLQEAIDFAEFVAADIKQDVRSSSNLNRIINALKATLSIADS